ncbi:hypothetical protein [Embleya sp. AB8]|uniref:hypothetical protein n=1 Tax=Embleya sp. AB8 TaxID=3156304 RepID=UPI003C760027
MRVPETTAPPVDATEAVAAEYEARQAIRDMWEFGFPRCPLTRYAESAGRLADRLAADERSRASLRSDEDLRAFARRHNRRERLLQITVFAYALLLIAAAGVFLAVTSPYWAARWLYRAPRRSAAS